MKIKKTKIRTKLLKAFTAVLFISFLLTAVIFNVAIRVSMYEGTQQVTEASGFIGRAGTISIILMGIMFVVAVVVTYFLSNSLTRPIEQLGAFALDIGQGKFTPNDFRFRETELEDLNMALNKSAKQLGEYDSQQKAFFQNASHELRTPLMSIKCYAEGISFGIMEPKAASETILQETDNLADLVTDLLCISKIDNITTAYTVAEADLAELIRASAMRQEAVAEKKQIRFTFDFEEAPILYDCVGELLSRAIDNLISNAIRYAASEIILSCHRRPEHIEICIADDGAGIEPDAIAHVFERFYKGKDGNHGIGLSIVKSIVEQRGGHVTAGNRDEGGAVFKISLPV
ncbi:MAG: HAMP domain-containing histidine kinase [Oscillospiraceae bacterium]|nr:HAMP domain-containing histidine kinase [Oscillospiraceae bacterium]